MPDIVSLHADQLCADLTALCAQPSSTGSTDELAETARLVAEMLRQIGLHVKTVPTPGAPVVLAWRAGRIPARVLLYHHYDVAPPGPWREWFHEPFQLAERDGTLYARGVALGKGPLITHMHALRALLQQADELPCGVALVIEGEGLSGSPHLAEVIAAHHELLQANGCLSTAGERDAHGLPLCYSGSKGLLRVALRVRGANQPLPSGLAASVPNPVWRLTWALNQIKGEDEDIRINGFYDSIAGPVKNERDLLRKVELDENGRLAAWQIPSFLFDLNGVALARSEVTLPTCSIASLSVEADSKVSSIPVAASAGLEFQLVPDQQPAAILDLLRKHLLERSFADIEVEALRGGYPALRTDANQSFVRQYLDATSRIYGRPPVHLPLGTFAQPLHVLAASLNLPVAVLGLARHSSAVHGSNEQIPLDDLLRHSRVLTEFLQTYQQSPNQAEVNA